MAEEQQQEQPQQKVLGISGAKRAGKNTSANFILGTEMLSLGFVKHATVVMDDGKLGISDLFGDTAYEGIFDVNNPHPQFKEFLDKHISPYIKLYSFADLLKWEVCIKILGLTYEQCFGTDEDKNTLTHLKWEDMAGIWTIPEDDPRWEKNEDGVSKLDLMQNEMAAEGLEVILHTPGRMTAREVLQYVGTNWFRRAYSNVWVDACLRQIITEGSLYAVITDVRFPNEVDGVHSIGGKVIRLTRNPAGDTDVHPSEKALDRENFDWTKFDAILDNSALNVNQQNEAMHHILDTWNWFPQMTPSESQ